MHLQTTHNTTTTSLQRELDTLRQDHQKIKIQLRELEMGNDDLERNERAVTSSLADVEAKYTRALEEKILLEHELLDKATLEEECQRLKDDLRGSGIYISPLIDLHTYLPLQMLTLRYPFFVISSWLPNLVTHLERPSTPHAPVSMIHSTPSLLDPNHLTSLLTVSWTIPLCLICNSKTSFLLPCRLLVLVHPARS
jgi:hypothetical protein